MTAGTTIKVPHLGGINAGYRLSNGAVDPAKPTVVLVNSMCMTSALYDHQFGNKALTDAANLLAIEPLGHGATECSVENFTYWDTAIMAVQVLDALGIKKAFALGTSQGGWIVTRMALVAPEKVRTSNFISQLCWQLASLQYILVPVRVYVQNAHHLYGIIPSLPIPPPPVFSTATARLQLRMACLISHSPNWTCMYHKLLL